MPNPTDVEDRSKSSNQSDSGLHTARAQVERIGPRLAELADAIDRGQTNPEAAYQLIAETDLSAVLVPVADGGYGLDFADYTLLLADLARYNGAAALGFNMHNVAIGNLFDSEVGGLSAGSVRFRDWVVSEVVRGALFASASSEPGNGARLRGLSTTYRREGDNYVIDGHKSFVSLAGVADYYVVSARPADTDSDFEVSHFVVKKDDPGVEFTSDWGGSALRGTSTAQMLLHGTIVPQERLYLGVEGMSLFKAIRDPHWMAAGYLGAYLGLATAIVEFVADHLARDTRRRTDIALTQQFGAMIVTFEATRSLSYRAAQAVAERTEDANAMIYAAKHHLGTSAQALASDAVQVTGSTSMAFTAPMQRLIREVQFCSIMPATPSACLDYVARARLGDNMLDVRTQAW